MDGKLYGDASLHAVRDQKVHLPPPSCRNSPKIQAFSYMISRIARNPAFQFGSVTWVQ